MLKNPILTTRFNIDTWRENCLYREKEKVGCIYGSPFILNNKIEPNTLIFVIEMNNSLNATFKVNLILGVTCVTAVTVCVFGLK